MPSFPFSLTKKHAYEVDADFLVLGHQLCDQGGVPHKGISEAGQHILFAYQLWTNEKKYSIASKSQSVILNPNNCNFQI
jgi:hypothetical protein